MRALIAENVQSIKVGLRVLLEQQPGVELVGEVADAEELLVAVKETCPELLLLSWELPGLPSPDVLSVLQGGCSDTFVIVLSGRTEARQEALNAGAQAFVNKGGYPEQLLAAIASAVSRGQR